MNGLVNALDEFQAGGQIEIGRIRAINEALRRNAQKSAEVMKGTVGYPTPTYASAGEFGPLVPQSIQPVLNSVEFAMKHLKLWARLAKIPVDSTVYEAAIETSATQFGVTPYMPEGDVPSKSEGSFEKKIVTVRYMSEYIEVSDISTLVGTIGFSGREQGILATRQTQGTRGLMAKMEGELWHGKNAFFPSIGFDGILKQIEDNAAANVVDLAGADVQLDKVVEYLGYLASGPNYAEPNFMTGTPRVAANLVAQATAYGRAGMLPTGITHLGNKLSFSAGFGGDVQLDHHTFLDPWQAIHGPNAAAQGDGAPAMEATTPTLLASTSGSKFTGSWAGKAYAYKIQARGYKGASIGTAVSGTYLVVSGGGVQIDIDDAGVASTGSGSVTCYDLFRLDPGQTTYGYAGTYARNTSGSGSGTRIIDINNTIPHTGTLVLGEFAMTTVYFAQLLDFLRRPLFSPKPVIPFLLMLFGTPVVIAPKKFLVLRNCGQAAPTVS